MHLYKPSLIRVYKLSIEVSSWQSSSIVAHDNSIRVDHRYYLEYIFSSELVSLLCESAEPIEESFHHKGSISFSRVYSSHDED